MYFFQTYLGIKTGQILESVMTRSRAKRLIRIGWCYCIMLTIFLALSPRGHGPYDRRCQRHEIPQTVAGMCAGTSGIILIIALLSIQVNTGLILKERANQSINRTGCRGISTARLRLYKRAMATAGAIALVYSISWVPTLILFILNVWSFGNREIIEKLLGVCSFVAFGIQTFANAVIFRLKNLEKLHCTWCQKRNQVLAIALQPRLTEEDPGRAIVQQHSNIDEQQSSIDQQQIKTARIEQVEMAYNNTRNNSDVCAHKVSALKGTGSAESPMDDWIEMVEYASSQSSSQAQTSTQVTTC